MADKTAATESSRTSFPAPLDLEVNDSKSNISSQPGDEPYLVSNATSKRPANIDVPTSQQRHNVSHQQTSLSPKSAKSGLVSASAAETSLPPTKLSAAHAAISQTVDLTNTANNNRLSQGNSMNDGGSRPTTSGAKSNYTTGSRSHVASLRTPASFQPMSSQRLQTQRAARPTSAATRARSESLASDDDEDDRSRTHRNSVNTARDAQVKRSPPGLHTQYFDDGATAAPTSRGSDMTERTDWRSQPQATNRGLINGNTRYNAAQSLESFDNSNQAQKSVVLDPEKNYSLGHEQINQSRSPRSLVSAFRRQSAQESGRSNGHEKLSSQDTTSLRKPSQTKEKKSLGKNWEYFDGNTMFFFGGRLETAKDKPIAVATACAVVTPALLWFIFCAPWLWHHVSPAIPIIFAYLLFVTMSSFFHACFSDPGIYPRNIHPFPPEDLSTDPLALGPPTTAWIKVVTNPNQANAFEVPVKYCKSCNIWRPPRCHHCRVCDNCIDTQDHHCVWLNNCVGRRNYRYFFSFVGGSAILAIFLFGSSVGQIAHYGQTNYDRAGHSIGFNKAVSATAANGVAMALLVYGVIAFFYPAALWCYHVFLISRGVTTREYINQNKFLKKDRHRPFDQRNIWRNFVMTLLRPRGSSAMRFKKPYQEGDQRFGDRRGFWRKEPVKGNSSNGGHVEMQHLPEARLA